MEKTILHWLHELPAEYMDKAIKNHLEITPVVPSETAVPSMSAALSLAFIWSESPEGKCYWDNIYKNLLRIEEMPLDLTPTIQSQPTVDPLVHKPSHYTQGDIECIDALAAATTGLQGMEAVCTANAIKYLWRWKYKNGVQDLEKAKFYIDKLINELKK